uniref:RING-type domain-containing protein n=1 Tax=Gadus morhua TaxID=8049 RepID=A0A8C5BGE0_GADMO
PGAPKQLRGPRQLPGMASATFWSEEDFSCSICLDVFNSPVFTPCGHNFCRTCIATCWDVRGQCRCPFCNELFHTRPDLRVNTLISEMVDWFRSSLRGKTQPCVEPDLRIPEGSSTHQGLSNGGGPSSVIRRDLVESPGTAEERNMETKRLAELRSAPNECKCLIFGSIPPLPTPPAGPWSHCSQRPWPGHDCSFIHTSSRHNTINTSATATECCRWPKFRVNTRLHYRTNVNPLVNRLPPLFKMIVVGKKSMDL